MCTIYIMQNPRFFGTYLDRCFRKNKEAFPLENWELCTSKSCLLFCTSLNITLVVLNINMNAYTVGVIIRCLSIVKSEIKQ